MTIIKQWGRIEVSVWMTEQIQLPVGVWMTEQIQLPVGAWINERLGTVHQ